MKKKMIIDTTNSNETRMAVVQNDLLVEYESENSKIKPTRGNIYLAKIIRVEPSLQAAFVDYGSNRHGFLAYNEIHPDYFKIPTADKEKLLAEEENHRISHNNELFDDDDTKDGEEYFYENEKKSSFMEKVIDFFKFKPLDDRFIVRADKKIRPLNFKNKIKSNKNFSFHRKYSIQEVIKKNQVILIQVVKEERGNKGAAVTTRLSLAGKYCVLMPNTNKGGGISRKITDGSLRKNLRETLSYLDIKKGMGVIIRTAGQDMNKKIISRDYKALLKLWSQITTKTIKSNAPSLIHEEGNLIKRSVRDYFDNNYNEIFVNSKDTLKASRDIMKFFMPGFTKIIKLSHEKNGSLFTNNKIEHQILEMHKPIVNLKSGGYLVINQTEALVAIDVNSGKSTKQRNIEDTATKTNLEAAEEISRQLKLRDLAGLIVIDFIDMLERSNIFKVERKLRESVKLDRARVQCGRMSNFGLLEMTRQRLKQNISRNILVKCNHCNEIILSPNFLALQILRVCEEIVVTSKIKELFLFVSSLVANNIKNHRKDHLKKISKKAKLKIFDTLDFSNIDCVISSKKEVIYNNCDNEDKLSGILFRLEGMNDTKNKNDENINKKIDIENDTNIKSQVIDSSESKEFTKKKTRESFRAKAIDFSKKEKKEVFKNKTFEINEIKGASSKEEAKRNGWWNQ